jgi:hypothetical protein
VQGTSPFAKDAMSYVPGDMVAGRYRVTGVLGRGGFGAVYSGEHLGTQQPVAIKMLTSHDQDGDAAQRFYREARITAKLSHPNTVRVFDVGQEEGGPLYLVMELLRGLSLEQILAKLIDLRRPMTEAEALAVADPILRSLAEAHAAGLVHRDLKPANVMLHTMQGGTPVVKVLDFGCSHTQDSQLTSEGLVIGTPGYMSPEQCRGHAVDARSDLYALAVILYRAVTGRLPFEDTAPLTLMYRHANEPVPDPREVSMQEISPGFAKLLLQGLAKNPEDRFVDAADMRKALEVHRSQLQQTRIGHRGELAGGAAVDPGSLLERVVDIALRTRSQAEVATTDEVPATRAYQAGKSTAVEDAPPRRAGSTPAPVLMRHTPAPGDADRTIVRPAADVGSSAPALQLQTPAAPVGHRWVWPLAIVAVAAIVGVVVLALRPVQAPAPVAAEVARPMPAADPLLARAAELYTRAQGKPAAQSIALLAEAVQLAPGVPEYALALDAARKAVMATPGDAVVAPSDPAAPVAAVPAKPAEPTPGPTPPQPAAVRAPVPTRPKPAPRPDPKPPAKPAEADPQRLKPRFVE